MAKSSRCAVVNSCWPAVASFRRADIMAHASAIWITSWALPAAQLIERNARSCVLALATCSLKADIPAFTSAIPAAALAPAVLAVPASSPRLRSADVRARLSPSSAPSRATRMLIRLVATIFRSLNGMSSQSAVNLEEIGKLIAKAKTLARRYRELTGRPIGITGEVAEYEAARLLGLDLADARQAGYDAIRRKGKVEEHLQIKGRCILTNNPGQRLGKIDLKHRWDAVLLVLLDVNFEPTAIYEAKREA